MSFVMVVSHLQIKMKDKPFTNDPKILHVPSHGK